MTVTQEELQQFFLERGERELRLATLPATPADYTATLPEGFTAQSGAEFKFNEADPALADARAWAHKNSFSQAQFSEMISLHAAMQAREAATLNAARAAELNKLGFNATMRVSAIENFLRGHLGDDLASHMRGMLVTADIVKGVETLIHKFSSQGAASFSQSHRVAPDDPGKIPGYDRMSFEQRRYAQEQRAGNLR
jgi:urease gamma subunit